MITATTPQELPQSRPRVLAGRALRMMRETHNVGLSEMAKLVGCSRSHLSHVESGRRAASESLTTRICDVLAELPPPYKSA